MIPDFVAIVNAAWAIAEGSGTWQTTERVLRHWADVKSEERPYLAQGGCSPIAEPLPGADGEAKWTLPLTYYVYVSHTPGGPSPQELLLKRLRDLLIAFAPAPGLDRQTLGGLVESCRAEGAQESDDGWLGTDGVQRVHLTIVVG
jgi:hypothetical protein